MIFGPTPPLYFCATAQIISGLMQKCEYWADLGRHLPFQYPLSCMVINNKNSCDCDNSPFPPLFERAMLFFFFYASADQQS